MSKVDQLSITKIRILFLEAVHPCIVDYYTDYVRFFRFIGHYDCVSEMHRISFKEFLHKKIFLQ